MARLNRLGWFGQVAQIGSAIGGEFSYALLRTDSGLPDDALQRAFARLVASELVFQRGTPLMRFTALSTRWCRTRRTAACRAMSAGNRMRRSPKRCKLICPNWGTANPNFSHSIMAKRGWSRNQSPAGPRPVTALPPTWRWRKRSRNSGKPWTSWHYCRHPERERQEPEFCSAPGAALRFVKGQLLLRQGHPEAAEELYRKALGLPKSRRRSPGNLRAAMSLARLRRDQGRRAEACELLGPFTDRSPRVSTRPIWKKPMRCLTN